MAASSLCHTGERSWPTAQTRRLFSLRRHELRGAGLRSCPWSVLSTHSWTCPAESWGHYCASQLRRMPGISLDLRCIEFRSDQNVAVSAWRAFADALFISSTGVPVSFTCIVDTGTPFSVLPYSLWYHRGCGMDVPWPAIDPKGKSITRSLGMAGRQLLPG